MLAKVWTFQQLSGSKNARVLTGWGAPFGRPRHGKIVNVGMTIRNSVTYYPGNNIPTIHSFGTANKPFELSGRCMDFAEGKDGAARDFVRLWKDFVAEQVSVRAKWGDILSYIIFIHDIDLEFESQSEVAWKLTAEVLLDEQGPVPTREHPMENPRDMAARLKAMLGIVNPFRAKQFFSLKGLLGDVTDSIDRLIGLMNAPFAAIADVSDTIAEFETALVTDLFKITSGLQTIKTSVLLLRDMTEVGMARVQAFNLRTAENYDGILSGSDMVDVTCAKIESDSQIANLLALIADVQNSIRITRRGQAASAHAAQGNDTFESIAMKVFGDPSGARAIKDANHIRYGVRAQPGKVYIIPKRA